MIIVPPVKCYIKGHVVLFQWFRLTIPQLRIKAYFVYQSKNKIYAYYSGYALLPLYIYNLMLVLFE